MIKFINSLSLRLIILNIILCSTSMALNKNIMCNGKQILGRIEKITLPEKNISLDAKLDTGADFSSLSASDIKIIKRNNQLWVEFKVSDVTTSTTVTFEKPLIRCARILKRQEENNKRSRTEEDKPFTTRPVVLFNVCIGNQKRNILVNLTDRTYFNYPMLLGKHTIEKFGVLVDVSQHYLANPSCK